MSKDLKGWILLAVQFRDGKTAMFRIEVRESDNVDVDMFIFGEKEQDTLLFEGECLDTESREWTEECFARIPASAYTLASWKYYAADDPKWEMPHIRTPSERP